MGGKSRIGLSVGVRGRILALFAFCTSFMLAAAAVGYWQFYISLRTFDRGVKAVAGIDRAPTELLTKARDRLVSLAAARAKEATDSAYATMWMTVVLLSVATVGAVLLFFVAIERGISRPLTGAVTVLRDLA